MFAVVCFIAAYCIHGAVGQNLGEGPNSVPRQGSGTNGAGGGSSWGRLEVAPKVYTRVSYLGFKIPIYKSQTFQADSMDTPQYFYSPALIIDPSSAVSAFNRFTKTFAMTFSVQMWSDEYEEVIAKELSAKANSPVSRSNIRILPIEEIRIDRATTTFGGPAPDFVLDNNWKPFGNQPESFQFRITCGKNETCVEIADVLQQSPEDFVSEMVVHYSLQGQTSTSKVIQIKAEHIQSGDLFTTLNQRFKTEETVYMKSEDVKKLTAEIARNVVATEVTDEEFVSSEDSLNIVRLLESQLKLQTVSTESFDAQQWNSVFWLEENARPDKVTQSMNDLFDKSDSKLKDILKRELTEEKGKGGSASLGGGFTTPVGVGITASASASGSSTWKSMSKSEQEKTDDLVKEAKHVTQWNGEKFALKPMELSRANIAALRASSGMTTAQIKVTKSGMELKSRFNIVRSGPYEELMPKQREEASELRNQIEQLLAGKEAETGMIWMINSQTVPAGWLPCDGARIDCTTYGKLCRVIGGQNVPDLRGRFPVGKDDATFSQIGAEGGELQHKLTVNEMPEHMHTYMGMTLNAAHTSRGTGEPSASKSTLTSPTGGNQPHNNLPPYRVVQFVIKT